MKIERLSGKIRVKLDLGSYEIQERMIQRFTEAIDDPNPLWHVIAPPTFIIVVGLEKLLAQIASLLERGVHGGSELECYQPVRAGDIITVTSEIVDVHERQGGKLGKMVFITFELTYKNQRREMVAKCRDTAIGY